MFSGFAVFGMYEGLLKRRIFLSMQIKESENYTGGNTKTDNQKPGHTVTVSGKKKACKDGTEKFSCAAGKLVQSHTASFVGFRTLICNINSRAGRDENFTGSPDYCCTLKDEGIFGKHINGKAYRIQERSDGDVQQRTSLFCGQNKEGCEQHNGNSVDCPYQRTVFRACIKAEKLF